MEPGVGFEPTACGLQNRCSTTELTRQINDLQDRSEAWLQLAAVSSRNSRPAPLEPHLCLRRPGKCPPLSARPREGHPATHSASQTRVNALLPSGGPRLALDSRLRGNERSLLYGRSVSL